MSTGPHWKFIEWKEPPPAIRGQPYLQQLIEQLMLEHGRWALIGRFDDARAAGKSAFRLRKQMADVVPGLEITTRYNEVYGRYVSPAEMPTRRPGPPEPVSLPVIDYAPDEEDREEWPEAPEDAGERLPPLGDLGVTRQPPPNIGFGLPKAAATTNRGNG